MKRNLVVTLLVVLLLFIGTACGGQAPTPTPAAPAVETPTPTAPTPETPAARTILSMGPSNTEILVALGFGDDIIAVDGFSADVPGLNPGLPTFDMMALDAEQVIALAPDLIFATGLTQVGGVDPFAPVAAAGIEVIHVPTSASIAEIQADIRFIALVMEAEAAGEAILVEMDWEITELLALVAEVITPRTVYFEIGAPPFLFSFGHGVFLHEMIELIGAVNVFADQNAWFSVADEAVLAANPDVILTNVGYIPDPVGDILDRAGWATITAVAEGRVYFIDPDASSRPSHHIVRALWEMARAVYPELFVFG